MPRLTAIVVVSLAALTGCREGPLQQASDVLSVSDSSLDFGSAYVGRQAIDKVVVVHNSGRALASVTYSMPDQPFELLTAPTQMNAGDTVLRLRFRPVEPSAFTDQLELISGTQHLQVHLGGTGELLPLCGQPAACHELQFDVSQNTCIDTVLPDGASCDSHDLCFGAATCNRGRCTGTPISCDDQNPCTIDTCNAVTGCQHLEANTCPSSGPCMVGVCNPSTGCAQLPLADGTACGHMQTCDAAQVCVAGVCAVKDPPDGYVCTSASPCQGQGICQGSACVRPVATALTETWRFDSLDTQDAGPNGGILDDGGVDPAFHPVWLQDLMMDEASGELSLTGFDAVPILRANTSAAFSTPGGGARRCISWNDRLVCADYPGNLNGQVTVFDRATGTTLWDFIIGTARPDFAAMCDPLFMGRLAVLGTDRLAALFEGYPTGAGSNTTCRLYFLTILDASGALISSQQLTDPELGTCLHPHPYGFSADTQGNFYVGFAPTLNPTGGPPLHPDVGTTVMSFTRDGDFLWKFTDVTLIGGEMALADGVLYPENSLQEISTSTGSSVAQLPEAFGRAVVTPQQLLLAPVDSATQVDAYQPGAATALWTHALSAGTVFWGDQVRLATWSTTTMGDQTVALTFTHDDVDGGTPMLHAFFVDDGTSAFACPIQMNNRGAPQLFEIGNGKMSLMEGAICEKCDPPFAGSTGAFHSFDLPTVSPGNAPWTGTFGGANHDGQENTVTPPLQTTRPPN